MASFIRQNKTQVSRIKNVLEKRLRQKVSNQITGSSSTSLGRANIYASRKEMGMDFSYNIYLVLERANVIVKEMDNRLVFCFDLRDVEMGLQSSRRNLLTNIMAAFRYKDCTDDVYQEIVNDVGVIGPRETDKMEQTDFYRRTVNSIEEMCFQSKVVLKDGEYPFMKDRTLFPLIVFDTNTGSGWYISGDRYDMTYRTNHSQISFYSFNIADEADRIVEGIPMSLATIVDNKNNTYYLRS